MTILVLFQTKKYMTQSKRNYLHLQHLYFQELHKGLLYEDRNKLCSTTSKTVSIRFFKITKVLLSLCETIIADTYSKNERKG